MKAKFRRTDALLVAPILLIGGVGYWQQQRTKKARTPTRIEVRSLEILPPTPSDVARGFDTRMKLSLGYAGATPRGWGETDWRKFALTRVSIPTVSQTGTPLKTVKIRDIENRFDTKNDVYRGTYLLKLQDVPSDAPVILNGSFQSEEIQQRTSTASEKVVDIVKELNWSATSRQKGVKTSAPPRVSRFNGLKLKSITVEDKRKGKSSWNFDIVVICEPLPALIDERSVWDRLSPMHGDTYLVDSKGHRFKSVTYTTTMRIIDDSGQMKLSPKQVELSFYSWEDFPRDTSDLTFHTQISIDYLWPLEINIPVKNIPLSK